MRKRAPGASHRSSNFVKGTAAWWVICCAPVSHLFGGASQQQIKAEKHTAFLACAKQVQENGGKEIRWSEPGSVCVCSCEARRGTDIELRCCVRTETLLLLQTCAICLSFRCVHASKCELDFIYIESFSF